MSTAQSNREPTDAEKAQLENLRKAYEAAQTANSPDLDKAREAYQDLAVKLLVQLSGKLDPNTNPDQTPDEGYIKPGGWGSTEATNAAGWKAVAMKDDPTKFKVVDSKGVNIATEFKSLANAQAFIDKAKGGTVPPQPPAPPGGTDKDQFGVTKIYKDKAGGEINTNFAGKEMTRHYASGKPSEESYEYTCMASSPDHNSDVEFTAYEKINGFKSSPDTISDKETGPPHQDGAKSWVICEFMTDGSAKATFETEYPHPTYQKIDPKPATSIGGSIVGKWFGHKAITYIKGGKRWVESWIHFPVTNIDNVAAEQDQWRQYVKPMQVDDKFVPARGTLTTSRLDGINKGSPPDFKYASTREITPPT
jgi:hypothetical protein